MHAAAGGVGLIACQWAAALGATVISTVGSKEKARLAAAHGCAHTILYREEDFVARVKEITGGAGSRPSTTASAGTPSLGSLDCLQPLGTMVTFGNSSGPVPAIRPLLLAQKGSVVPDPADVFHYVEACRSAGHGR